jgi:hypothetical protein
VNHRGLSGDGKALLTVFCESSGKEWEKFFDAILPLFDETRRNERKRVLEEVNAAFLSHLLTWKSTTRISAKQLGRIHASILDEIAGRIVAANSNSPADVAAVPKNQTAPAAKVSAKPAKKKSRFRNHK